MDNTEMYFIKKRSGGKILKIMDNLVCFGDFILLMMMMYIYGKEIPIQDYQSMNIMKLKNLLIQIKYYILLEIQMKKLVVEVQHHLKITIIIVIIELFLVKN